MSSLPGYDAWKTTPPEYESPEVPCFIHNAEECEECDPKDAEADKADDWADRTVD